jgi:hypothetical protein
MGFLNRLLQVILLNMFPIFSHRRWNLIRWSHNKCSTQSFHTFGVPNNRNKTALHSVHWTEKKRKRYYRTSATCTIIQKIIHFQYEFSMWNTNCNDSLEGNMATLRFFIPLHHFGKALKQDKKAIFTGSTTIIKVQKKTCECSRL